MMCKVCYNFCVSQLGPAPTYLACLTQVLPLPPPSPERSRQDSGWGSSSLTPRKVRSRRWTPFLIYSFQLAVLFFFSPEKQWRCADWGGQSVETAVGRSYTRVVILCIWDQGRKSSPVYVFCFPSFAE